MSAELLPCPFCGMDNALDQYPSDFLDGTGANVVRCAWCHGAAPLKTWNRRAQQPSATEAACPAAWQWRSRIKGGAWDAWESGRFGGPAPPFMDIEERRIPAPTLRPVSDEDVEKAAESLWNTSPHKLLEKAGHPTDWKSQPETIKRDYRKQGRAALESFLVRRMGGGE